MPNMMLESMQDALDEIKTKTATLTEWEVKKVLGRWVIWGKIVEDPTGRFTPGDWICTSPLKTVNFKGGVAQTENSLYLLVE